MQVIEVFASGRKASEKTGVSRCVLRRILQKEGKAVDKNGFFWRFHGETHGPWPDPQRASLAAVEQLDFNTGDVLASFNSLADAKWAMNMRPSSACIRETCDGLGRATANGFFWRWKGSDALPNHMMGVQKIVQIRKTKNGPVHKEFCSSREAQEALGYQCCWSTICRYCREEGYYDGYYWKYRMIREKKSEEEAAIGRRLRIKQRAGNEWLDGKIKSFDKETGNHEIQYDNGDIETCTLQEIRYEWKHDQGQKPVEQIDLKTGQVIHTYKSISEAANSVGEGAKSNSGISAVCKGHYRSSFGFFWRFKGSDALPPKSKARKKVEQLCLKTGRVIAIHDSISAAGKAVGITTPGISYCCNGRNQSKSAGGFGWRFAYVEDE